MPGWLQILIGVVSAAVLLLLAGWLGRSHGKKVRGNLLMASFLLGLGHAMDPPPAQKVEAAEPGKGGPLPGEPPQ